MQESLEAEVRQLKEKLAQANHAKLQFQRERDTALANAAELQQRLDIERTNRETETNRNERKFQELGLWYREQRALVWRGRAR